MPAVHVRQKPGRPLQLFYVDPLTGRDITKSAGTSDRREAERLAIRWEAELNTGQVAGITSWDAFRERFEAEHLPAKSRKTTCSYTTALNHFERLIGHPKDLRAITANVLSQFKGKLTAETNKQKATRPPATVGSYLQHVQSALAWAKEIGLLSIVPRVKLPPKPKGKLMKGRPISLKEFDAMIAAARELYPLAADGLERFLRVLWLSGLRISEAVRLAWDAGPIRVDLDGAKHPRLVIDAAGQKSRKNELMPITPDFTAFLKKTPEKGRRGPVCPVYLGQTAAKSNTLTKMVSAAGSAAKIEVPGGRHATAHDLRRSFGTRWAMKVRPITLQRLMRHSSIETTLRYYVDVDCDDVGEELWK